MSIYHATSLSGKGEEDPQSKKTTGSTVPRDVLARPSSSHQRQPFWGPAIDAPTWFVPGTALAMPESHPERQKCSTMNLDHLEEEGSTGRPCRSSVTRYGTRGPGSQADGNAKTNRHGLLAGDDGASHRRRPSSLKGGNRCAGTGATSWPGPALPNTYDADNSLQCMTLPNLD